MKEAHSIEKELVLVIMGEQVWIEEYAAKKMFSLIDNYMEFAKKTQDVRSKKYFDETIKMYNECDSYKDQLVKRKEIATKKIYDKFNDSEKTKKFVELDIKLWNEGTIPNFLLFFKEIHNLQKTMSNTWDFAMKNKSDNKIGKKLPTKKKAKKKNKPK